MLVPFPIAFFVGAFACDLAYWRAADAFFTSVALWLIGAGFIKAAFAAVAGWVDFLGDRRIRQLGDAWQHMIGNILVVVLELFNFLLRYRDPMKAVVPTGPIADPHASRPVTTSSDLPIEPGFWYSLPIDVGVLKQHVDRERMESFGWQPRSIPNG